MDWAPSDGQYGVFTMIIGSLCITILALIMAVPLSILCAIFMAEIAPPAMAKILKPVIETLAGIPSVVYGFFGLIGAGIFLIPLYYIILPFEWGSWIDGFPYSIIVSAPGYVIGSLIGLIVGPKIGQATENVELMIFLSTFLGGVLGSMMISFFTSYTFFVF